MNQQTSAPHGAAPREITFTEIAQALWRKLKEMRTVLWLLSVIAVAGVVGMLVPQGESPEMYAERYGSAVAAILGALGLTHLYHTGWFTALLALLLLSLAACTRRLWIQAHERWRLPEAEVAGKRFRAGAGTVEEKLAAPAEAAIGAFTAAARRRGYHVWNLGESGESRWAHVSRRRWAAFGLPLTHYAIFLIAIGALLGVIPGLSLDTQIEVPKGEKYDDAEGRIPFTVQLNDFKIQTDPNTGAIDNYYSDVSILEGGKEAVRQTVSVNHPLTYKHFTLSQASWGLGEIKVEATLDGKQTELKFPVQRGCPGQDSMEGFSVPDENAAAFLGERKAAVVVTGFYPDAERKGKEVTARMSEGLGTPALQMTAMSGFEGGKHSMVDLGWLLPGEQAAMPGGSVKFLGVNMWSGLGVRKDYGITLVWAGFIGCLLGLMLIFYFPAHRATVRFEAGRGEETAIAVAYQALPGESEEETAAFWRRVLEEAKGKG